MIDRLIKGKSAMMGSLLFIRKKIEMKAII